MQPFHDPARSEIRTADVMTALREGTRAAHDRMERALDLPGRLGDPAQLVAVIERFHGFHAVWEPAIGAALRDPAFHAPRMKLPLLRADLRALGHADDAIDALPVCHEAWRLASEPWGSIYVLEGSTLGGQVIARQLERLPNGMVSPGYFRPYGNVTGAMWRALQGRLTLAAAYVGIDAMVQSASATFDLLHDWLSPEARNGHERAA
ncbi:biliverdin-producing heme oxygenase [Iodidimonas sp. SYSU 1G8]|uniref:biliverdin-producing heme oxygenase n=1 Tax=Iodidimonas sp. SYSU 1G8 TaxID=3133967 RepID=UPI0031FEA231